MIENFGISLFGLASVISIGIYKNPKWGCMFGLMAEPAWFYHAYKTGAWGIYLLSIVYAISWSIGVYNYWIKESK